MQDDGKLLFWQFINLFVPSETKKIQREAPPVDAGTENFSLALFREEFILFSGGADANDIRQSGKAILYSTKESKWMVDILLGELNEPRNAHSSLCIGSTCFVFGGYDGSKYLDSLESLSIDLAEEGLQNWTISMFYNISPRASPLMAQQDECNFVIYGGYDNNGKLDNGI